MAEKPSEEEVARVRAQGREILDRLRDDPAFLEEVRKDPTAALTSRGIPLDAATEWQKPRGEVQGFGGYDADGYCTWTMTGSEGSCFESSYY